MDIQNNPLITRSDFERAALDMLAPLEPLLSEGCARLNLGETGAVYPADIAEMEAFSRPLWAIVPMLVSKSPAAEPLWKRWREGLKNGTDPAHPEYWGDIGPFDQRMVEMAVMGMALCLVPERFLGDLTPKAQDDVCRWLGQINAHDMPKNNWRFFRVLVNCGFMLCGRPYDRVRLDEDLALVESHYEGQGWYYDYETQRDYYTPWAFHYYGLIYAIAMKDRDPERAERFKDRARLFAPQFAAWFSADGAALPFGRSLTYRFAQSAFFAAMAAAGVEAPGLGMGEIKHILLQNMRWWLKRPIFTRDGVLTIGYGYPNLIMGEGYNAFGSAYWAMKSFAPLMLPGDHPFWKSEERPYTPPRKLLEEMARMLIVRDEQNLHVQAFTAGQHCKEHAHDEAKYEKFVYSTAFAFSVPKSAKLYKCGAFDSMLAVSEDGVSYHARYGCDAFELTETEVRSTWRPFAGVTVSTRVIPMGDWHVRVQRIVTDRPLKVAEGGFAIRREDGRVRPQEETGKDFAVVKAPWGVSGVRALRGFGAAQVTQPEPNTNLLYPRTLLPSLAADVPAGETVLVSAVLGAVVDGEQKWADMPQEVLTYAAVD